MEIKLVTGATAFEAAKNVLKEIDLSDTETTNLVVVPDAFSLQAENLIFECLSVKATFNVQVVGISRLASKILREKNIPYKRISALEEIFAIHKAIKSTQDKFVYFSNVGVDLSLKILQVLKQFKACKISLENLKPTQDDNLDRKMHDLKLIFDAFQDALEDRLDLSKLLDFFVEKTENEINLQNIRLFFVNFDSFSLEISDFICRLAGKVKSTCIGMAKPISAANEFVFEDDILRKTTQIAKTYHLSVSVENYPTELSGNALSLVKNLFSFDVQSEKSDFLQCFVAKNTFEEADFVAKYIKYQINQGKRFQDFAVAVSDKKYFDILRQAFSRYEIAHYVDDAVNLSQTILGRFVLKMLSVAKNGFDLPAFQYICSCPLFESKSNIQDVFVFQIDTEKEFLKHFPEHKPVIDAVTLLSRCKNVTQFAGCLKDLVQLVSQNHAKLLMQLEKDLYFKKQSENAQAEQLLLAVLDKLETLARGEEFSIFDFENLLRLSLESVKVETVPSFVDAVFVGDATSSYFEDVPYLFVLGCSAGSLPKTQKDAAIVDDDDIKKLKINFALEPEIRVINRRNRLKLFELLPHAQKRLVICYPANEDGRQVGRAEFVDNLCQIFGENVAHASAFEIFGATELDEEEKLDSVLFQLGNRTNFLENISKMSLPENFSQIFEVAKKDIPKRAQLLTNQQFGKEFVSASELETFFACPFRHFLQYQMKILPTEPVTANAKRFGTFEHQLLKLFVSSFANLAALSDKEIGNFVEKFVPKVAKEIYDQSVLENGSLLRHLKRESKIILQNVVKEQKYSAFRPILTEEKISMPLGQKKLIGFVDRVDRSGNFFRILDYKTGRTSSLKKELFHGKKLQLFLYAQAIKNQTGLDCAGVYYFNCQTKYSKFGKSQNLLAGMTLKDNDVALKTDCRLQDGQKSDLVGFERKLSAKEGEFAFKNGMAEEDFQKFFDYAVAVSEGAVSQIQQGFIEAKPMEDECEKCPYQSICTHTTQNGERKYLKV